MWPLALVASVLSLALLLITSMRLGGVSVALGMLAGVAVAGMHLLDSPYDPIRGSRSAAAGLAGAVIGFIVMAASGLAAPLLGASWRSRAATPTAAAIAVVVAENTVDPAVSDQASATNDHVRRGRP